MWILPKNLPSCPCVPDTEALSGVFPEQLEELESSLMWRSKLSLLPTWLRRWNREKWIRHLFGRILRPCHWSAFQEWLTSSLGGIRASHSVLPVVAKEQTIPDICGPGLEGQLMLFDLDGASSRMLKATLPLGCVTSSTTWDEWVIEQRGEYSQRLKRALRTGVSESLSWHTPLAQDGKHSGMNQSKNSQRGLLVNQVNWPPPRAGNPGSRKPGTGGKILAEEAKIHNGLQDQANPNTTGKNPASWPTPHANAANGPGHQGRKGGENLQTKVQTWPSPQAKDGSGTGPYKCEITETGFKVTRKTGQAFGASLKDAASHKAAGKLSANWVEQLMGLPVGWTQLPTEWID